MSSFDTDVARVLNDFDREFQIIAQITLQFDLLGGGINTSTDIWLSTDPPGLKPGAVGFAAIHPVARKLGRVLAYQDTDIFGRAQGSMTIEARNEVVVWPSALFPSTGYMKLSEILSTGNVMGLPIKLWLLVRTGTGPLIEQLGEYTLDKVDLLPDSVRFRVLDLEPYIRDVPISTIDSAALGTGLIDPDDEFQGRPIPLQFGIMGKGVGTQVEPESVGTGALLELFRGYITPYNPAPCVGLYRTYVTPSETSVRTVLVCQDGGMPSTSSGLLAGNLVDENLYYATDDGRFAYLNTIESLFAFNSDNRAWLGLIEGIDVPGANDRTITGVSVNMAPQTAVLPVFPWADTDTSGTNAIWDAATIPMGPNRPLAVSRMFSDMLEPTTNLVLTSGQDYAEVWGYMPDEPNHGPVRGFDAFTVVSFSGLVDVRFKLDIDDTVTTVQAVTGNGTGSTKIITSAFDVRNSGSTKPATIDDWYRWRFEYENTTPNERRRSKFAVGFKVSAGGSPFVSITIHNAGLKVTYVPGLFKTVDAPIETISGLADPIFPGLYNDTRLRTVKLTEIDASTRFFVSTDGVVDTGVITQTAGALLKSPVHHIQALYRFWGRSGGLFVAPVPGDAGASHDSDYGNWGTAASTLDDLLEFYTTDTTGWDSSYTVSHQAKLDVHVEEFRRHLPLDVWKDRKGRLRCAVWVPSPLAGEVFPAGSIGLAGSNYVPNYLGWTGQPGDILAAEFLHPHHIKRVKNIGLTDAERTHTEFVVHWGFDKGRNEYRHKAICNAGIFDDGFGNNWDSFFDNLHKQTCEDAQERAVGVRTLTRMAPTIFGVHEAASMLMHYVRRYTMRHIVLELELDLSVSDMEKWQLVKFAPESVTRENFGGVSMPYHNIDWGGDVAVAGSEWWRVMRKYYDYDAQSIHVTLMHVAGVT